MTYCYKFFNSVTKDICKQNGLLFCSCNDALSITLINYLYISFAYIETVIFFAIMIPYSILFFKDKIFVRILIPLSLNVLYSTLSFGINYFFSGVIDCDYNYLMTESTIYRYILCDFIKYDISDHSFYCI